MKYNQLPKGFKNWTQLYMDALRDGQDMTKGLTINSCEDNIYIYPDVLNREVVREFTGLLINIESPRLEMGTIMTALYNHYKATGIKTKHDILTNLYDLLISDDQTPSGLMDLEQFKQLMR